LILILNHFKTSDFDFKSLFRCVILISNHFTSDLSQHCVS